ncbi:AraC family transcriptional regulator [Variovorax sp. V118]
MGFTARPSKLGTFAMMSHCIMGEPSLEEAFRRGIRFYELFTDDIRMSLENDGDRTYFKVAFSHPELDPQNYFLDFWLSIWYRTIGWLGGRVAPLYAATFTYSKPKEHAEEFKYMFPCPCTFDALQTSLVFDRAHLQSPIVRTPRELKQFLALAPLGFMTVPGDVKSFARQVRAYLLKDRKLPLDFPEFSVVAMNLGMAEQTLRRKLKAESSSYRAVIEDIRRDLAIQTLLKGGSSVGRIAEMLGYSEPRAFTRAFREWTGCSPAEYRENFQKNVRRSPDGELIDPVGA